MFFGISCRHVCPELTSTAAEEPGQHMRGVRAELCVGPGRCTNHGAVCSHEPHSERGCEELGAPEWLRSSAAAAAAAVEQCSSSHVSALPKRAGEVQEYQ